MRSREVIGYSPERPDTSSCVRVYNTACPQSFSASGQEGNVETEHGVTVRLDTTPPLTTASVANAGSQATVTLSRRRRARR
jgi:hypothetical protein